MSSLFSPTAILIIVGVRYLMLISKIFVEGLAIAEVTKELMEKTFHSVLFGPYGEFNKLRKSDVRHMVNLLSLLSADFIRGLLNTTFEIIMLFVLFGLVFWEFGISSIYIVLLLSFVGLLIGIVFKKILVANGQKLVFSQAQILNTLEKLFSGFRFFRISSNGAELSQLFEKGVKNYRSAFAQSSFIGALPKVIVEGSVVLTIIFLSSSQTLSSVIKITL